MKVLSLFDGISCGQVALERAGVPVEKYYASEIDKYAIQITQKNYPDTVQLGDVCKIDFTDEKFKDVDLLIGGSPCQSLSIVLAKTRQNLDGKSKLFFEYIRALETIKPKWFLLENVASMTKECKDVITQYMGVEPVLINSSLFSAQERKRLYWTNIPLMELPKENTVVLGDILEKNVSEKYFYDLPLTDIDMNKTVCATMEHKNMKMHKRVYNPAFKCSTLTCVSGGNQQKKVYVDGKARKLTPVEYERLQTLEDDYTKGVSDCHRYTACGNGWTVDLIAHIFGGLK